LQIGFYYAALPAFFVLLCRRRMREEMAGYSDEETEDVTFRRLMTAQSATRELHGPGPIEYQDSDAAGQHKPPEANHHSYAASCRPATWLSAFCTACAVCTACTACALSGADCPLPTGKGHHLQLHLYCCPAGASLQSSQSTADICTYMLSPPSFTSEHCVLDIVSIVIFWCL